MLTTAPKSIRENIARAKGYLRRDEGVRARVTMSEAVRRLMVETSSPMISLRSEMARVVLSSWLSRM